MKDRMFTGLLPTQVDFDWDVVTATIVSTLAMMVDHYYHFIPGWKGFDRTVLYFVVPMLYITVVLRKKLSDFGFQVGDWKTGIVFTVGTLLVILPVLWLVVRSGFGMSSFYQPMSGPGLPLYAFFEIFGWEFIFRGWLTFSYTRKFGVDGLWLQAVPFTLGHSGKPEVEAMLTLLGGFFLGWVAYRTRSFLYPFLIHFAMLICVILAAGSGR